MNNSLLKILDQLDKGEISSVELTKHYLDQISKKDKILNSFISINENALNEAKVADKKRKNGEISKLLGVPVALKDIYSTKDLKTTAASRVLQNYIPPFDATATKKYKDAGAVILGKTNLDAWAYGSSGENSDFGPTKNPYGLEFTPGGSSSGSASAVAAGLSPVASGTDTGGSIRLPAGFCNVVGLKPTYGRVSRYGIIAMGSSFDSIGHFTTTVYDSAYLLSVTAGIDPLDSTTGNHPVPDYHLNLNNFKKGTKIGVINEFITKGLDSEIKENFKKACMDLESLGCEIIDVSLSHIDYAMATYYILVPAEISSNLGRMNGVRFGNDRSFFTSEAKRRIMIGTYTLSSGYYDAYYSKALKVRSLILRDFEDALNKVDLIVSPTSPTPPFKLGEKIQDPLLMYLSDIYVCPVNLSGMPSISVPMQPAHDLPCGIQFIGRQFDEQTIFNVAHAYEQKRGDVNLKLKI